MKKVEKGMKQKLDLFKARAQGGKDHIDLTIKLLNGSLMADVKFEDLKRKRKPSSPTGSIVISQRKNSSNSKD
jgi:hypothetical protein